MKPEVFSVSTASATALAKNGIYLFRTKCSDEYHALINRAVVPRNKFADVQGVWPNAVMSIHLGRQNKYFNYGLSCCLIGASLYA